MPRQPRLDIPGALHHVIIRGINKSPIFNDDLDKARFLDRLGHNVTQAHATVFAWVLMTNHAHILFRSGKHGISTVMRKLLSWYAQYYNRRHKRSGHLFENRYKSILCDENNYLTALIRYIHLNPVRAHMVKTVDELNRYPWCGHRAFLGKTDYPWMDINYALSQFGNTQRKARAEYHRFISQGFRLGRQPELTGGGLVRSLGGWSEVIAMRRKNNKTEYDERILGSGAFVQEVLKEAEEKHLRQLKYRRSGLTISKIIDEECRSAEISVRELKAGGRRHHISSARARIAFRCKEEIGSTAAEIARQLGVATSSVARAIGTLESREKRYAR